MIQMTEKRLYFHKWREFKAIQQVKKDHKDMINLMVMDDKLLKQNIYDDWKNTMLLIPKNNIK
jgi:hypothetical protein